jgi:hypothetical protein
MHLDSTAIITAGVGGMVAAIQMFLQNRTWVKWTLLIASVAFVCLGTYNALHGTPVVVTVSDAQKGQLGEPYPHKPLIDPMAYQGLYDNGFVLWVDGRFFELSLDHQYWASFLDSFPASEPRWFTRATLQKDFPQCGDRLPIGGLAKAMKGPQKHFYAWLGCLQGENTASTTSGVVLQQFSNGWVIEGVLNPPQSPYRTRILLINGDGWSSQPMDNTGHFVVNTPH